MITVTEHEKREWVRMAQAAYASDHNEIGHRYSIAASMPRGMQVWTPRYDRLMADYRAWLVFNEWPA